MTNIKVLATGSTPWQRTIRRWGVSFLIGDDVLFDAFGDARVLLRNIRKFNVDRSKIRHIVISHDHWDHLAGLPALLQGRPDVTVYLCPNFAVKVKQKIKSYGAKVVEAADRTQVRDRIFLTGEISGRYQDKPIYEQALVVESDRGLTVIVGCSHPGVVQVAQRARNIFGKNIYCVAGGFHLKDALQTQIQEAVAGLRALGVQRVAPTHCTGATAVEELQRNYQGNMILVRDGIDITV